MALGTSIPAMGDPAAMLALVGHHDDATWSLLVGVFVTAFLFAIFCGGLLVNWLARRQRERRPRHPQLRTRASWTGFPFWTAPGWRWMGIHKQPISEVQKALQLANPVCCSWQQGLWALQERKLFISPPAGEWIVVLGEALPDPARDIDQCYLFLVRLSRQLGRVVFFHLNRLNHHHAWVWVEKGRVVRAYAWTGKTVWNEGKPTAAEIELGMRCFDYGEGLADATTEARQSSLNLEKIPRLAALWSLDLMSAGGSAFQQPYGILGELPQFHSA